MFANNRNRVRCAVLGPSQDGASADLFENLSVNNLKGDLSNATTVNQGCGSVFICNGNGSGVRGFDDQNLEKITAEKKSNFLNQTTINLSPGLHKGRPSYKRSLQLSKENTQQFSTSKHEISKLCLLFAPFLDPDPTGIRIRIRNPAFNPSLFLLVKTFKEISLQLLHETVVDTSVVFPHKMGPPFKRALKFLAADHLKRIIQNDGERVGGLPYSFCEITSAPDPYQNL